MIENLDNNAFENQFGRHPPIDGRKSRWRFAGPCANGFNLIAGPYDGNRKGWLSRAAARAHVSYRQIRALWYGETSDPKFSVANSVLSAGTKARLEMERIRYASAAEYCVRMLKGLPTSIRNFITRKSNALGVRLILLAAVIEV